jgi:hypothetical protein
MSPKTIYGEKFAPTLVSWQEVSSDVKKINPLLFDIIEQFGPSKKLRLYKVRYPYGAKIVDNGQFNCLSERGELLSINHECIAEQIKKDLTYRTIPLALVMYNSAEVFIKDEQRVVPMRLLKSGELFGVFEIIESPNDEGTASVTNVSSGARSAFLLPKISDSLCHKKLVNELGLSSSLPNGLADHGLIFAEVGSHPDFVGQWYSEILFFSKDWFEERNNNAGWVRFTKQLYEIGWYQSQYWRNQTTFGLLWKTLISAIKRKNIRPRPYLVDTVKHLIFVSTGAIPGFSTSEVDQEALPAKIIQDLYIKIYGLKSHFPIIMIPHHFLPKDVDSSVYYSLSYPTLLETSLNPKQAPTIIEDLRDIKQLIALLDNEFDVEVKILHNVIQGINFDFYTCEQDIQGKINSSTDLPRIDKLFCGNNANCDRTFPYTSPFLRGCIRISKRK